MPRHAVRQLQQSLSDLPRQQHQSKHRADGNGLLLCYYQFFRSPFLGVVLVLFAAAMYLSYASVMDADFGPASSYGGAAQNDGDDTPFAAERPKQLAARGREFDDAADKDDSPNPSADASPDEEESRKRFRPASGRTAAVEPGDHELSIQQSTLRHLRTLPAFPKIVHLIWPDGTILSQEKYEIIKHGAANLRRLNPDWEFIVHDYESIDSTIRNFRHPDIPRSTNEDLLHAHVVEKTDAFRLIKIYQQGGLYVDIDRVMNKNLNDVIDVEKVKMVVATFYDVNFTNDLFGSSPGNELLLKAFKRQCHLRERFKRRNGWIKSSDQMRLVETYTASVERELFRREIGPDSPLWDEARHVLNAHSGGAIVTYKDVWCDGLLVRDFEGCKGIARDSLYEAYGVEEWKDVVNEVWGIKEGTEGSEGTEGTEESEDSAGAED